MWTEKELRMLTITQGNVGFRDFMIPYGIDFKGLHKYRTKAGILYLHNVFFTIILTFQF